MVDGTRAVGTKVSIAVAEKVRKEGQVAIEGVIILVIALGLSSYRPKTEIIMLHKERRRGL
ncbi:hypothetical protein PGLA_14160 [Paenibacillus glacialis]|uniref:Uncharacterized protein n=1 Tax=Paenibacillus glacialis TaxID=494026 RepID=A0A168KGA2_9BACL|nr:hypothetical protein PGLA_14160 [Paenibacillus glacialis]